MKIDPFAKAKARNQAKGRKKLIEANELTLTNAMRAEPALYAGDLFKYDLFANQILVCHPIPPAEDDPAWVARELTDTDVTTLMRWFLANGYVKVTAQKVQRSIEWEAHRNAFNPAQDALRALPAWDKLHRLDGFFEKICGTEIAKQGMTDQEVLNRDRYHAAVGRCFFIGLVARIMDPGCKNDTMVILEGEQGEKKSTLLRQLSLRSDWFSDSMPHDISSKDAKQHLQGHLIIEMGELNQMGKSRAGAIKQFLSMQVDEYRPPYGRYSITQPRQCIFVGTTNHANYFTDETGNRRYWPITCGTIDLNLAVISRDQLYAEALEAYKDGERWWLPEDIEMLARIEQDKRLADDPWEDAVQTVVDRYRRAAIAAEKHVFWVTPNDAFSAIDIRAESLDAEKYRRICLILRKKGGQNMKLPRNEGWPKNGFKFVLGRKGSSFAGTVVHGGTDKPLN